jgi:hypothetical protein
MNGAGDDRLIDIRTTIDSLLTNLTSFYIVSGMARFKDILLGISHQTTRKCEELATDREELNKLRDGYQRYRELAERIESTERNVKIGMALLISAPTKIKEDAEAHWDDYETAVEMSSKSEVPLDSADMNLSKYSLWRVIREIVRQTVTIRVFELEDHLKTFGIKTTRAAIESALATHPKEFRITKRGREKYVSLKGA